MSQISTYLSIRLYYPPVCLSLCTHIITSGFTYISIYTYVIFMCVYIYIYIYIHTHTQNYVNACSYISIYMYRWGRSNCTVNNNVIVIFLFIFDKALSSIIIINFDLRWKKILIKIDNNIDWSNTYILYYWQPSHFCFIFTHINLVF